MRRRGIRRPNVFSRHAAGKVEMLRALRAAIGNVNAEMDDAELALKQQAAADRAERADLLFSLSEPNEGTGR